ncbi:zinc ribbon domain-containing protein [Bradyrhizobium sp. 187]|uniref:Zn-ribbon domain-containing OB-fold protein n=1 Tax=Bradyrhizobium sp. 187 TaxID=2782655 RepID=UPI001FFE768E|nr:zinc ribbon domain-containing protein [Bradyrhizobium sp. 187]UPJ76865.1 OB-fold domain-containing protein [Bradyrhizobium sp. 187]
MNEAQQLSGPEEAYQRALNVGRFVIQRCGDCERPVFYPRTVCPHCGANKLSWFSPIGEGHVYSTTTVRRDQEDGGDYNVCIVELAEGVRLMSSIRGILPDRVIIGTKVRIKVVKSEGKGLVICEVK